MVTCNSFSVVRSSFRLSEALKVFRLETKSEIAKKKELLYQAHLTTFFLEQLIIKSYTIER